MEIERNNEVVVQAAAAGRRARRPGCVPVDAPLSAFPRCRSSSRTRPPECFNPAGSTGHFSGRPVSSDGPSPSGAALALLYERNGNA
jgi:hypothetical protein